LLYAAQSLSEEIERLATIWRTGSAAGSFAKDGMDMVEGQPKGVYHRRLGSLG